LVNEGYGDDDDDGDDDSGVDGDDDVVDNVDIHHDFTDDYDTDNDSDTDDDNNNDDYMICVRYKHWFLVASRSQIRSKEYARSKIAKRRAEHQEGPTQHRVDEGTIQTAVELRRKTPKQQSSRCGKHSGSSRIDEKNTQTAVE